MSAAADSRDMILKRIEEARLESDEHTAAESIPRSYERNGTLSREARLALFEERLLEYGATFARVNDAGLPARLASAIEGAAVGCIVVPAAVPMEWRKANVKWLVDYVLATTEIETAGGVLTAASIAVASTGTIILQHGALEGRRIVTLLPDHHFCVVREEQVVESLPEAFAWMGRNPTLPTTLISGPSATADIEMTRIKGVHGPRNLHVVLVVTEQSDTASV